ncbi:MAG: Sulfate adenylyltransferase subunit 1 [archaeon GW2011_AR20]|nr:MAG: Sulfate adenylyltransferase subunit 1 [archaeon GW2011_AR20]AQS28206.1 hypothetical protein [uncultured archaeon]
MKQIQNKEQVKIVIVGHMDHGKSTLIGRLLYDTNSLPQGKIEEIIRVSKELGRELEFAYLIDNLEEEREQQLTMDTAQTFFKTKNRNYVIIDAPGHKEFIKNMITGASQADAAVLLLDAKEGIKEQTRRHAYILKLLDIKNLIVAVNKMDLIDYNELKFNKIKQEILGSLSKIGLNPDFIIPISALKGENILNKSTNMNWYGNLAILEALDKFEIENKIKNHLRMPIQDIYNIDNKKIIVGKVESGKVKVGDEIKILPINRNYMVKSIEIFNSKKDFAMTGENIGLTLDPDYDVRVGMIISHNKNLPQVKKEFNAKLFWMNNELNLNEELILKCATQEIKCKVKKINKRIDSSNLDIIEEDAKILKETEVGEVVIETEKEIVVENFNDLPELGRFVIIKNLDISGAGIIN